jgi:hypothetical protein
MSNRVRTKLQLVPLTIPVLEAMVAGELIHACGGTQTEIETGQKGVGRRLLEKIIIFGVDADGYERDKIEFSFNGDISTEAHLDLDGGKRSTIEALDAGLARAVVHAAERLRKRGLRPDVRYVFTDEIYNDAKRLAAARADLNIGPVDVPPIRPGYERRETLRLRPAKDSGILGTFFTTFKE